MSEKDTLEYRKMRAAAERRLMDSARDCRRCGAPYDALVVEEATYDEDGELITPPEIAWAPICECWREEMSVVLGS